MKKLLLVALLATMTLGLKAQAPARVPAYRGIIERVQPNGDTIQTYLRGDEHYHYMMTLDGWEILRNDKGWYVYAKRTAANGDRLAVKTSRKKVHNEDRRSKCETRWLEKHGVNKGDR